MSKGKNANVEKKKPQNTGIKKAPSAYQTGKSTVSKLEITPPTKKSKS